MRLRTPLRLESEEINSTIAVSDFESRSLAFDALGMKQIAARERTHVRGICGKDCSTKAWVYGECGAALEHDNRVARKSPKIGARGIGNIDAQERAGAIELIGLEIGEHVCDG